MPTTREMNGGSNAIKYSHIFYFPTSSQERSRYGGNQCHLELPLYDSRTSGEFRVSVVYHQTAACID